jgi:hypothetical protein
MRNSATAEKLRQQTAQALALSHDRLTLSLTANASALCGDAGQTNSIIDELTRRFPTDTLVNEQRIVLIQAALALHNGNSAQTLELLETTRTHGGYLLFPIAYVRGQAYLHDKKGAEAAAQFQEIIDHRGWSPLSYFLPVCATGIGACGRAFRAIWLPRVRLTRIYSLPGKMRIRNCHC